MRGSAWLFGWALVAAAVGASAQPGAAESSIRGFVVSPLMFRVSLLPGQSSEFTLSLQNLEPKELRPNLAFSSVLWEDHSYTPRLDTPHDRDCSAWFETLDQSTIEARQRREVKLRVQVPRQAKGPYWTLLTIRPEPVDMDNEMRLVFDIPVIILVGGQPNPDVKVAPPNLEVANGMAAASLDLENRGASFSVINVGGEVTNLDTRSVVGRFELSDRNLYPQSKRRVGFGLGSLPTGRYRVRFQVDLGTRRLPPLQRDVVVQNGQVANAGEAGAFVLPPLLAQPSAIVFPLPPGGQRTQRITLSNTSTKPLSLNLEAVEVRQTTRGTLEPGQELPTGVRVTVSPATLTIPPGRTRQAVVRVSIDKEAQGDLWFGVRLSGYQADEQADTEDLILCNVPVQGTLNPKVELAETQMVEDQGVPVAIRYTTVNSGNQAVRPRTSARLLRDGVQVIATLEVPVVGDGGVLPGGRVDNEIPLPHDLAPGEYLVVVEAQFGPESFARGSVTFQVPKPKRGGKSSG